MFERKFVVEHRVLVMTLAASHDIVTDGHKFMEELKYSGYSAEVHWSCESLDFLMLVPRKRTSKHQRHSSKAVPKSFYGKLNAPLILNHDHLQPSPAFQDLSSRPSHQ